MDAAPFGGGTAFGLLIPQSQKLLNRGLLEVIIDLLKRRRFEIVGGAFGSAGKSVIQFSQFLCTQCGKLGIKVFFQ